MSEEPKSIWKKSLSRNSFVFCLLVAVAGATVVAGIGAACGLTGDAKKFAGTWFALVFLIWLFIAAIRWFCCWRNFKRFLFGLACLATLIALFYAEENWRGKHDWKKFKREWEAKGEKFDFKDFVPPPVPDDQNFAMAPVFDATVKLASRQWRNEHRNQHPDAGGNPWDTNLVDRLQMGIARNDGYWGMTGSTTNGAGYWQAAKKADLKIWQNYYRTPAAKTNEFPIAPEPQLPGQDVLLALSKYDPAIQDLRLASRLPSSRFPLDYADEDPAEILLPHLATLKRCSQVLQLRALAELAEGQNEKALDDVNLALHLADSVRTEPFIITHLVRIAILEIALQPVWEGLAEHKWSGAQLVELDHELAGINFLADYEFSVRGERASHIKIVDWLEQKRSRYKNLFEMVNDDARNTTDHFALTAEVYLMPRGWYYQGEIVLSEVQQRWILPMVSDAQQTVSPQLIRESTDAIGSLRPGRVNLFARLLLPNLGSYARKVAYGQNAVNLTRMAIALERYRLAHGEYPESLDALAPQFMEIIPHDVIGGQPLKYRREADGQFVLYSIGWNETDDGGVVVLKKDSTLEVDLNQGDWVWRYPAK